MISLELRPEQLRILIFIFLLNLFIAAPVCFSEEDSGVQIVADAQKEIDPMIDEIKQLAKTAEEEAAKKPQTPKAVQKPATKSRAR